MTNMTPGPPDEHEKSRPNANGPVDGTRTDGTRIDRTGVDTVLCDLDGVVWLSRQPIPGAVEAVASLAGAGISVLFVTNNSTALLADQEAALASIGIDAAGHVLTSAMSAAALVAPNDRVLVCAEAGVVEAVGGRGAEAIEAHDPVLDDPATAAIDMVVVGQHRGLTWDHLRRAVAAIRRGARFVATNDDATFPTPSGPVPGAGAIVAAVATAAGMPPVIAGKPHQPMADLTRTVIGPTFDPLRTVVVGDRPSTDGAFASTLGCRFARVRSGVDEAAPADAAPNGPWIDVADLAAAAAIILRLGDR